MFKIKIHEINSQTNEFFWGEMGFIMWINSKKYKFRYYELIPPFKLTKNKPLEYAHFEEFLKIYKERKITPHSYLVSIKELEERNYDLSAKNPNSKEEKTLREVEEILSTLKANQEKANELLQKIQNII